MTSVIGKFFKHAGFVVLGGAVSALISLASDASVVSFISSHPWLSLVVPAVSGLLGSLAKYISDQAAQ